MPPDLSLYALMLKSRLFEEATAQLWHDGLISGESHLGTGEEAVIADVVPQLLAGDAMALDHRGSAALLLRGVAPVLGVLDLRTVAPLDITTVREAVARSGRLLVVDEDYEGFGLSGELSALVLEAGIPCRYARVCTRSTIPYARHLEDQVLPNEERICLGVKQLMRQTPIAVDARG
jgi:transketolase C-terminal domain/subunit